MLAISLAVVSLAENTRLPRQKTASQAECQHTPARFSDGLCATDTD
ncbi:hypothetical protein HMPREF9123_1518 [Neisseria bacilliformis ATCC BAA-1200]|uniref:Uncharacterized protein n=1 Tax=Neisseria bacilliformis ATCC BAA-1200 TaxID=888742 RepID=F2BCN0_9NEIS|nr:hypothetical protein HMPREF9123_1518 [Neisseria bacilliformis ATCC BAA-1200]